jgi:hypothetical protein
MRRVPLETGATSRFIANLSSFMNIAIGVSHAESAAFSGKTLFLQVHCDVICSIAFGPAPVATASNQRLAANETR